MAMTLTSKTHPYKAGFEPFMSDVYRIPYAYCYRCSYGLKYPDCELACARALEDAFKRAQPELPEDVLSDIAVEVGRDLLHDHAPELDPYPFGLFLPDGWAASEH